MICRNPRLPRPKKSEEPAAHTPGDPNWTRFIRDTKGAPILTREEERIYIQKAQAGDPRAAQKICVSNLRFIIRIAIRYQGMGLTLSDLTHEGTLGMLRAIPAFSPAQGVKFTTYAVWWIRQAILKAIKQSRLIRIASHHDEEIRKARSLPFAQVVGGTYVEPVSPKSKIPEGDLRLGIAAAHGLVSMHGEYGDGAPEDFIANPSPDPDAQVMKKEQRQVIRDLLRKLPARNQRVISLLFGLETGEPMTLQQVGDILGVSRERARQLRTEGLKKMRKWAQIRGIDFPV